MFGRNGGAKARLGDAAVSVKDAVADAAAAVGGYVDPLRNDEKMRQRLAAAIAAGAAARQRARRQTRFPGLVRRLNRDPVLRAQVIEMVAQLQGLQKRANNARSRKLRNALLVLACAGMVVAAVPPVREGVWGKETQFTCRLGAVVGPLCRGG
jgi:hypothetical protein